MTREEKKQFIRQKAIEVNPKIEWKENLCTECDGTCGGGTRLHSRDIRLADVIRTLGVKGENEVYIDNEMELIVLRLVNDWMKHEDDLVKQDEELLDFIILVLNSKI